jgi:hypothetical protein
MKSKQVAAARCSARDDEVRASRLCRFARHLGNMPFLQSMPITGG